MEEVIYKCGNCDVTVQSIEGLKKHIGDHHNQTANLICGQPDCEQVFLNKTSLIRHIRNFHQDSTLTSASAVPTTSSSGQALPSTQPPPSTIQDTLQTPLDESNIADNNEISANEPLPSIDLNKVAGRIILELRSRGTLTGIAIQRFQEGCDKLLCAFRSEIIQSMTSTMRESGVDEAVINKAVLSIPDTEGIFQNLKTIEEQLNYFASEYGCVKPVPKFLGSRLDKRLDPDSNTFVETQVNDSFQYVPIISTLEAVLNNKKHFENIFKDFVSKDGVYKSYFDGSHYKDHPFVKKYGIYIIHIILWYDELEVANALGSKTIIHKLGVIFFQILNGAAEVSSKLSSIHLLTLAYAEDLKRKGAFDTVLSPFIRDMKKLSSDEGVTISVNGQPFVLRVLLAGLTADTLAAHDILGFLAPSARFFCRCCLVSREELRADANSVAPLRTKESHAQHVEEVLRCPKASSLYGVKRDCPLNQVPFFDCTESSVFDAFHDLLEGIVPLVIKLVLRHYIYVSKYLTIQDFNVRVQSFSYGIPDSKNRPSPNFTLEMLQTKKSLKQTGAQTWCLMRALPFLLADNTGNIKTGDKHMELVFLLQEIMQVVFSFEVTDEILDQLDVLIFKHNELFKSLFIDNEVRLEPEVRTEEGNDPVEVNDSDGEMADYSDEEAQDDPDEEVVDEPHQEVVDEPNEDVVAGDQQRRKRRREPNNDADQPARKKRKKAVPLIVHFRNKFHHLKHYCAMMRRRGPAVRVWCAKFEGRLKIFRQHSAVCCNFKNIVKTMAEMFQLSNVIHEDEDEDETEFKKGNNLRVADLGENAKLFYDVGLHDSAVLVSTTSATINGEEYRPGLFVKLPSPLRHFPQFAIISKIFVHERKIYLQVKPWKVVCLSKRYNCYRVVPDPPSKNCLLDVLQLSYFRAMAPWTVTENDAIYLSLRTVSL